MADKYTNRIGVNRRTEGPLLDPDLPEPGCYRIVLRKGAPASALRIWLGPSIDPATGQDSHDRGWFWQCTVNGQRVDFHDHWPGCAREPISREEHDRLVERNATMDETSPFYDPKRRVDLRSAPMPF